ncbi:MAG TPA: hypothetical protein VHY09_14320 [Candidatus Methylacidiphilales bacterium]|nr:hypothetical protein [Candidatus Methylacidiphilales bacterium]
MKLRYVYALAAIALAALPLSLARAEQKTGMPDLAQEEQTCLPTSTTNLIVWFGKHGYPKLIVPGDSDDDGFIHTLHAIMEETNARYDFGTRTDAITGGIANYIRNAGYSCDVEYRGIDWNKVKVADVIKDEDADKYKDFDSKTPEPFSQDWLSSNGDPSKGFILLLAYVNFDRVTNSFSSAINAGHAVTLVDAEPETILIHDPAHYDSLPGRKVLTPDLLTAGVWHLPGYNAPVSGLMLLSGSDLETPGDAVVMLTGAVCVTMHPNDTAVARVGGTAGAPNATIGAAPTGTATSSSTPPPAPAAATPASANQSWAMWIFDLLFKK